MASDLEERIDALYALPLDRFTAERDALARNLRSRGDREAAERVGALRKPVVSAWALNELARRDPGAIGDLEELGERLRAAERQAVSGGDPEPLREALEERRATVARLAGRVRSILEEVGASTASQHEDVERSLDAAAVDERAVAELRAGRLVRPMRPPAGFGGAPALTVLPGQARRAEPDPRERERELRSLRGRLSVAEARVRRATAAASRERARFEEAERRRSEARERLRASEAEQRGASLEAKRLAAEVAKRERGS